MDWQVVEVGFDREGMRLAGDVWLPVIGEPVPILILVPGSGPADRDDERELREHFAQAGIGTFAWDKPGEGHSTGDWRYRTIITDRSAEVRAAIIALRSRADIPASVIGLWGISQGGWIVPTVAAGNAEVSFVIAVSAPGISVREQIIYSTEQRLRESGLPEDEVASAGRFIKEGLEAGTACMTYEEVNSSLAARYRDRPWYGLIASEITPETWSKLLVSDGPDLDFSLAPVLPRVTCPLLAVFGEQDQLLPVAASSTLFEQACAANPDLTIKIFPRAGHGIRLSDGAYAPGYPDLMSEWILARIPPFLLAVS